MLDLFESDLQAPRRGALGDAKRDLNAVNLSPVIQIDLYIRRVNANWQVRLRIEEQFFGRAHCRLQFKQIDLAETNLALPQQRDFRVVRAELGGIVKMNST